MALDLQSARYTVNTLLSPPRDLVISSTFETEGLLARGRRGAYLIYQRQWYHFYKENYNKKWKSSVQEVGGHAAEDQKEIRTSSSGINHLGSVHTKFYSRNWSIQSICYLWKRGLIRGRGLIWGGGGDLIEDLRYCNSNRMKNKVTWR